MRNDEVIAQAKKWLGYNEKDGSFKVIIDTYNTIKPLPRRYPVKYTDEWCATFVSAVYQALGYTSNIYPECSAEKMRKGFQSMGLLHAYSSDDLQVGDIVFYDWNGNGSAQHVGIVSAITSTTVKVIEGNVDEAVKEISRKKSYKCFLSTARPVYVSSNSSIRKYTDGEPIKLKAGASYTNGKAVPAWVIRSKCYYRGTNSRGIIFSIYQTGAITGTISEEMILK